MRKRLIGGPPAATPVWLDLDDLATVEITSEDRLHPIESALLPGQGSGWLATLPGTQTIRLLFTPPQAIRRIRLSFVETAVPRTQEYLLRWSADAGLSLPRDRPPAMELQPTRCHGRDRGACGRPCRRQCAGIDHHARHRQRKRFRFAGRTANRLKGCRFIHLTAPWRRPGGFLPALEARRRYPWPSML
jgi:hypothetical protein